MNPPPPQRRTLHLRTGDFSLCDWGGAGPLLHLAHATGFCAGSYQPLAARLAERLQVVAMDMRGHGETDAPADPTQLHDWHVFGEDLAALYTELGGNVIAAGHSLGGVASLLAAVAHPELMRALVLLDPTILPPSWQWPLGWVKRLGLGGRFPIAARAAARRRDWPSREVVHRALRHKPAFRHWRDDFFAAYVDCAFVELSDGSVRLRCAPAWEARVFATAQHDVWRYLPRLRCPVMVIYGAASDTFRPAAARAFARAVPRAQLHAIPGASHFVPQEKPDEVATLIESFVEKLA